MSNDTIKLPENYSYKDFANDVAKTMIEDYGEHLYEDFIKELYSLLKATTAKV